MCGMDNGAKFKQFLYKKILAILARLKLSVVCQIDQSIRKIARVIWILISE